MNTIYWHMNATQGGANLHPGVNLPPGADLHPGANCAHEHGFRNVMHQKEINLIINSATDNAANTSTLKI